MKHSVFTSCIGRKKKISKLTIGVDLHREKSWGSEMVTREGPRSIGTRPFLMCTQGTPSLVPAIEYCEILTALIMDNTQFYVFPCQVHVPSVQRDLLVPVVHRVMPAYQVEMVVMGGTLRAQEENKQVYNCSRFNTGMNRNICR